MQSQHQPQNPQGQQGSGNTPQNAAAAGPAGRRFHIAHRRSPSEYTPLMLEQYALQQQIEALQAQQQALASQLQPQQFLMQPQQYAVPVQQFGQFYPSPPQVQQQTDLSRQPSGGHGRNRSMHAPNMPPPPAPSAGSNSHVFDTFPGQVNPPSAGNSASPAASRRGGAGGSGGGHVRRHSLALTEAKERAAARQQANAAAQSGVPVPPAPTSPTNDGLRPEYTGSTSSFNSPPALTPSQVRTGPPSRGHARSQSAAHAQNRAVSPQRTYQFPPNQGEGQQTTLERRGSVGSSHQRTGSRTDTNWRQPQDPQPAQPQAQQPGLGASQHAPAASFSSQAAFGHRSRGSVTGGSFSQFPQGMPGGLSINPLYAQQAGGLPPILSPQLMQQQQLVQLQLQQQQQRKSLFAPYLPQGQLPALLQEGKLVSGILRVNKKNRSDAYVSTDLLESDIFICGSKDRNRALEGDFVAVELLDVDEVWAQKREKEDKKKRRGDDTNAGGLKRQGSIRIREGGKRKDDVEVEGQGLLLDIDDEEEVVEGQGDGKPMYAGHVVAVMERIGGQLFSGTLGLLRPSSAATKEKQEQERLARGESSSQPQYHKQQEKPKIVWFKPTDKRVPLIAIPTEQAPKDFVDNHQNYSNTLFVAAIKRWPITSLHPFGTLIEELGPMGDVEVESEAILRDNNFTNEKFSDNLLSSIPDDNTVVAEALTEDQERRDFREINTFTIDPATVKEIDDAVSIVKSADGKTAQVGVHIADVSFFVRPNSLVDREARKRSTSVYLVQRAVSMLPDKLSKLCSLEPGMDRLTISVVFTVSLEDATFGSVNDVWMGQSVINSNAQLSYEFVQTIIDGKKKQLTAEEAGNASPQVLLDDILLLHRLTAKFRADRYASGALTISSSPLHLEFAIDSEDIKNPIVTACTIKDTTPATQLIEELMLKANAAVAERIRGAWGGEGAFLRRHDVPIERRLEGFLRRCRRLGIDMDVGPDGRGLMKCLARVSDQEVRSALEALLVKSMQRAKYVIAGKAPEEQFRHYALNIPLYTHFTSPIRRYPDIVVHRQLQSALANESTPPEDAQSLIKVAETCNFKKDAARTAQEQSIHLFLCRMLRDMSAQGPVARCGIVVNVQSSSFDVVIPEFGIEKRVHLDQLPLVKAEFDRPNRVLELFWEKGVDSMSYNPEEVKPRQRTNTQSSLVGNGKSHWRSDSQAEDDLNLAVSSMGVEDNMALFDAPVPDSPPTKLRVPAVQVPPATAGVQSRSAPTSPVNPPADSTSWIPSLPSESGRTASLMNVTIGESNGRPSTGGTDKEPVEELREEEAVQIIRELCRVWVVIRAEVAGVGKSGASLIFLKATNPFA